MGTNCGCWEQKRSSYPKVLQITLLIIFLRKNRQVTPEDGKSLALRWGCSWTEASARHNENVG